MPDPGLEGLTVARWVYETLTQDPTLRTLAGGAAALLPRVTDGPPAQDRGDWWVEYNVVEPRDVKGADEIHIMAEVLVQVKVVGPAKSYTPLMDPYRRVHQLLTTRTEKAAGLGVVLTSSRVSGVQYPSSTSGIEYRHLGGLYRTRSQ